jgi:hypothetical protein
MLVFFFFHAFRMTVGNGRTYDCHAREDGKGEPGACYGRDLREPSFQADDGHRCCFCS